MKTLAVKFPIFIKLDIENNLPLNLFIFAIFTIVITFISIKVPDTLFSCEQWIFRVRKWEKGGEVYNRIFKVKNWKNALPELGDFIKNIFPKKQIKVFSKNYLQTYLLESCKAELTHWCIIFSTCVFVIWCDFNTFTAISIIALALNLPYVAIQRYNRPRILKLIHFAGKHEGLAVLNLS